MRLAIAPTPLPLAFAGDLFLNLTDAEVGRGSEMMSISLTVHGATGGRPRCFSPSLSCLHAGDDPLANRRRFELLVVNKAQPIGLSVSTLSWTLMKRMPRWSNSLKGSRRWRVLRAKRSNFVERQLAWPVALPR
jgi:hypothetical protein